MKKNVGNIEIQITLGTYEKTQEFSISAFKDTDF